ncbi:ABZJ_00895 family protein [Acinetobacter sp. WZC-1]|uniref:ABZJ_00895 family protein n=1 Tax=Acinetobacter sp. WZC-1 TaxID=3459034 RepID=UPI00403DAD6F
MPSLNKYFLWFFLISLGLTLLVGVVAALLPRGMGGVLTVLPYLIAMIIVLQRFLKQQRRAPTTQERKKFTLGYTLIFWGYNLLGMLISIAIFAQQDPQVWQLFLEYMQQPAFISIVLIMIVILALPLYLVTWWFYGRQAQRMAAKLYGISPEQ